MIRDAYVGVCKIRNFGVQLHVGTGAVLRGRGAVPPVRGLPSHCLPN